MPEQPPSAPDAAPSVTVIVPALNEADVIRRCVDSLLRQDHPRVEVLVVDDGSDDGTPACVPPPARVLRTTGRTGAGAARNLGARAATGTVLFFTDADCVAPPHWVSRGLAARREHGVRCGGGGYAGSVGQGLVPRFGFAELAFRRRRHFGFVQTLVSNNLFCDKDLFLEVGGFPETYRAASSEDMIFSWQVARRERLYWHPDNGVFHDFERTLGGYLRQQARFARDAIRMFRDHASLPAAKTHHGKQLYLETALMGLALAALGLLQGKLALLALALLLAVNVPFLIFLARRQGLALAAVSPGLILLRELAILWGAVVGVWRLVACTRSA
jgi:glycosyltransferase involved in cell wall biosynthesis